MIDNTWTIIVLRILPKLKIITPENNYLIFFHLIILLFYILFVFEIGFLICFGSQFWNDQLKQAQFMHIIFICLMLIDMFLSCFKSYYLKGILISSRKLIVQQYISFGLWIDILGTTLISHIGIIAILIPIISGSINSNFIKIAFIPKIYNMSYIIQMLDLNTRLHPRLYTLYSLSKLVVLTFIVAHYSGIFFYLVSYWVYTNNIYGPKTPSIVWLWNAQAVSKLIQQPWSIRYSYLIYYSVSTTTTIAYADIVPLNPIQTLFTIGVLLLNTVIFGYILSQLLRILVEAFSVSFTSKSSAYSLAILMQQEMVKRMTTKRIKTHLQEINSTQMYRNRRLEHKLMSKLPRNMKNELYLNIYRQFIIDIGMPFHEHSDFINELLQCISEQRLIQCSLIYNQNQRYLKGVNDSKVYYLKKQSYNSILLGVGQVRFVQLNGQIELLNGIQVGKSSKIFGLLELLTGWPRLTWALCRKNVLCFTLSRKNLEKAMLLCTQLEKQHLFLLKDSITNCQCLICQEEHFFFKCPYVTYHPSIENIMNQIITTDQRINSQIIQDIRAIKPSKKYNILQYYHLSKKNKKNQSEQLQSFSNKEQREQTSILNEVFQKQSFQYASSIYINNCYLIQNEQFVQTYIKQTYDLIEHLSNNMKQHQPQLKSFGLDVDCVYNWSIYKTSYNVDVVGQEYHKSQMKFQ